MNKTKQALLDKLVDKMTKELSNKEIEYIIQSLELSKLTNKVGR